MAHSAIRRSEWILWAFLLYTAILAALTPLPPNLRLSIICLNLALLAAYILLVVLNEIRPRRSLTIARDWLPLLLVLLAYQQMGWFAVPQPTHALEANWITWDRAVLHSPIKAAIESLGPVLPMLLEISYSLVYALVPFSVAMLYVYRRRDRIDQFLVLFLLAVLLCYGQFPFWPSQPPRTLFPTEDLPYDTIFRRWNLRMLGAGGIHTSVFPSAHVSAAVSVAIAMWHLLPEHRWVGRFLTVLAALITTATVYGRYHYLADATAGLLIAIAVFLTVRITSLSSAATAPTAHPAIARIPTSATINRSLRPSGNSSTAA